MLASRFTKKSRRIALCVLLLLPFPVVASAWVPFLVSGQLNDARFVVCLICFVLTLVWCGFFVREEPVVVGSILYIFALLVILVFVYAIVTPYY